jgi:methionyl-tRNA formyltransferase
MAGDAESGVTVMKMDEGLDTGDMAVIEGKRAQRRVGIGADMTAGELHDAMAQAGAGLMAAALSALEQDALDGEAQPADGVTYAAKIDKAETRIDWSKPWQAVHDHIRGLSPFPGAWCEMARERVKVLRATKGEGSGPPGTALDDHLTVGCGGGSVRVVELQKAGGRPMRAEEFLRGTPVRLGLALG